MGKNLRTPQTLVYEEWIEEGNTSQSVVECILQLNNRLKRCQDIAITRMKECHFKRKTWYDRGAVERKFVEGDLIYQEEGTVVLSRKLTKTVSSETQAGVEEKPDMNPQLQATHKLEQNPSLESSASFNPVA
ncbi:CCHC-type domain-containing protein [Trichonephila clavipes]|nr:CCHC-type domain-containing protein [Trichonephila clavipes]